MPEEQIVEHVLRGGPEGAPGLFDLGDIATFTGLLASSRDARDPNDTLATSRIDRGSLVLDLGGRNADDVWNIMVQD